MYIQYERALYVLYMEGLSFFEVFFKVNYFNSLSLKHP